MFGRFFGIVVEETKDTYIVAGINGRDIGKFITNVWKTSVIEKYMFKRVTGGRFGTMEFYKFFLIDVIYMLETLANRKNPRIPARTLNQIVEALKEKTWFKDIDDPTVEHRLNLKRLNLFDYTPLPFQAAFLDYYNKVPNAYGLNGALLNGAPGVGKSASSMMVMTTAEVDRIIVVAPKHALIRVWVNDINAMFKQPPEMFNTALPTPPTETTKLFVYHYEALEQAIQYHKPYFGKYTYGLILDESHNFNDIKTQRTQRWVELVKLSRSNNVLHISGTPFKALGSESIPLLRAIDPLFTPVVEDRFKSIFGHSAQKGLDILRNRLGIISYKIEKHELGLEKPIITLVDVKSPNGHKYTLTAVKEAMRIFIDERLRYYKQREQEDLNFYLTCLQKHEMTLRGDRKLLQEFNYYKDCVKAIQRTSDYSLVKKEISFAKQYEYRNISASLPQQDVKAFRSVCSTIKYLTLKIQGECLGQVVGRMRIEAHVDMCNYIPFRDLVQSTKKKTVVFTSFVDALESAFKTCEAQELKPLLVYAKTNNNLNAIIHNFEQDERLNPLIATYDSLSTAVPLVMADNMILINSPFRSYILDQAIARIHRLRQENQVTIWQCRLDTGNETNISSRSLDIMQWSQEQVEKMTGVKSPYTIDDSTDSISVSTEGLLEAELDYRIIPDTAYVPKPIERIQVTERLTSGW